MASDSLYENFARVLLGDEPTKHIAIVSPKTYLSSREVPPSKYEFRKSKQYAKFQTKSYPLTYCEVVNSFCASSDSLIFIVFKPSGLGFESLPVVRDSIWILILESVFDNNGNVVLKNVTYKNLNGIQEFEFINKETLFQIAEPQKANGFCLQWDTRLFKLSKNVVRAPDDLTGDIKLLSSLFCGQKYEPQKGMDIIYRNLKLLNSEAGKQIAQKMIEILKDKI